MPKHAVTRNATSSFDPLSELQEARLAALDDFFARRRLKFRDDGSKGEPAAWFLGPKAENKDLLRSLVLRAIKRHCEARRSFHPRDPKAITKTDKASRAYRQAVKTLERRSEELFEGLQLSAPIWSMRHQGHMLWDQALPAVVGYFGAMLYNQNNVAAEASPFTTKLEIEVGNELCELLGFSLEPESGAPIPWGHITCDGSIANIESLWAARNIKFFPVALRAALSAEPALSAARRLTIETPSGDAAMLLDLNAWELLNLDIDQVVALPGRMTKEFGINTLTLSAVMDRYAVQNIGLAGFQRRFMPEFDTPIAIAPITCHYSWPKAGTLLGLGQNNIRRIKVDLRARMKIDALRATLRQCLRERLPVLAVIAVIGSTEESAVDPLCDMLTAREEFRAKGLNFAVHCDAAWGGYFASLLRDSSGSSGTAPEIPASALSAYVVRQLDALKHADSVTIDPHKAGYVPYPAGALCYRNSAMRDFVSLKAPVVFHSQSEPTVGVYGIEGSKPGAAAAGVYLAHNVIRPNKAGYGRILSECVWTSTRLYCRLVTMEDPCFKIVLLPMLPTERDNKGATAIRKQRKYIREHFVETDNRTLVRLLDSDKTAKSLFHELGSDLVILAYSFNFFDSLGRLNRDPVKLAKLNTEIFKICSITSPDEDLASKKLILTASSFTVADYGADFIQHYCDRLGIEMGNDIAIPFLISTTMDPWTTETPQGDFLAVVEDALREAVHQAIDIVHSAQRRGVVVSAARRRA